MTPEDIVCFSAICCFVVSYALLIVGLVLINPVVIGIAAMMFIATKGLGGAIAV